MTSYLTIQTATDARPRRVVSQDFARLFAEEETRTETRVERLANAMLGVFVPLHAKLVAVRIRAAKQRRRLAPRLTLRPIRS